MPVYGCIADDFTGATDMAGILANGGIRVLVVLRLDEAIDVSQYEAIVVALKTRTSEPTDATEQSLEALHWLRQRGCLRFHFKYCSTFDSRPTGNIGPVMDALMAELDAKLTIVCPAFPANGRTVYNGYLFVGQVLLSESSMRNHPLTPMHDASLIRLLQPQTGSAIGLVPHQVVSAGESAVRSSFAKMQSEGTAVAIVDAIYEADLLTVARASADLPLTTGASGLALGVPQALQIAGLLQNVGELPPPPRTSGRRVILSGSCSVATRQQVAYAAKRMPVFVLDAIDLSRHPERVIEAVVWATAQPIDQVLLISASADPATVRAAQDRLGVERAGALVEEALATIAEQLTSRGVRQFIIAGGETSGAVVKSLHVQALQMGSQIDPGVNWVFTEGSDPIALALKSGNFGSEDFFTKAWDLL